MIAELLRGEGIRSLVRPTNFAAGVGDGYILSGPREILVRPEDEARAREFLDRRLPV